MAQWADLAGQFNKLITHKQLKNYPFHLKTSQEVLGRRNTFSIPRAARFWIFPGA
jgi:hypothetical protein